MTPEAQRIAIAEACGWRKSTYAKEGIEKSIPDEFGLWVSPVGKCFDDFGTGDALPDYLNDLNAMHAVIQQTKINDDAFLRILATIVSGKPCRDVSEASPWNFIDATAAQRAEAFLRTIGKWRNE